MNDGFDELQYLSDTLLVEKVLTIDAGLRKDAGVAESLAGVKNVVDKYVLSQLDTSSTGAFIKSLSNLLVPAMLFRIHPALGILSTVGLSAFGIKITDIWDKVIGALKPKLESGQGVSAKEVNDAAMSLVSSASTDLFEDLRKIEKRGELVVTALGFGRKYYGQPLGGHYLIPRERAGVMERVFGNLSKHRGKMLLVAFVAWFIKTILASAGLLIAGGTAVAALAMVAKRKGDTKQQQIQVVAPGGQQATVTRPPPIPIPATTGHSLKPSGAGEQNHPNGESNAWVIPLYGDVKNTLFNWAKDVYPELAQHKNEVYSSASFNRIANMLSGHLSSTSKYLIMPSNLHTRKQVVDTFAAEAANKIPKA